MLHYPEGDKYTFDVEMQKYLETQQNLYQQKANSLLSRHKSKLKWRVCLWFDFSAFRCHKNAIINIILIYCNITKMGFRIPML